MGGQQRPVNVADQHTAKASRASWTLAKFKASPPDLQESHPAVFLEHWQLASGKEHIRPEILPPKNAQSPDRQGVVFTTWSEGLSLVAQQVADVN